MPFHVSLEFSSIQVCQSLSGKESACQCRRLGFNPWVKKIPWRRKWQSTPVFSPGKSHGQRSLVGCSPWGFRRVRHEVATKQQQLSVTLKHKSVKQETRAGTSTRIPGILRTIRESPDTGEAPFETGSLLHGAYSWRFQVGLLHWKVREPISGSLAQLLRCPENHLPHSMQASSALGQKLWKAKWETSMAMPFQHVTQEIAMGVAKSRESEKREAKKRHFERLNCIVRCHPERFTVLFLLILLFL